MLPPGEGAEAIFTEVPVIGSTVSRESHEEGLQEAETTCANTTVEAATFSTLFPNGLGGFGNTPTGCTHRHYIHKTLGSVAHHFARAHEVFANSVYSPLFKTNRRLGCAIGSSCGTTIKTMSAGPHSETAQGAW